MKISDTVTGLLFMVAGIAIVFEAQTFPAVPGQAYGSSFFPTILGVGMSVVGFSLALSAVIRRETLPLFQLPEWLSSVRGKISLLLVVLSLIFYLLVSDHLGFCFTAFIIVAGLQVWMKNKIFHSLLAAVLITGVVYFLFSSVLRVPLPYGVIERFLY